MQSVLTTAANPLYNQIPKPIGRLEPPNTECSALLSESAAWQKYCAGQPPYSFQSSPFVGMPPGGRQIQEMSSLVLNGPFDGTNQTVLTFRVPVGYDGVITRVINVFTGTGLVEGSGDIVWRLKIGNMYARNLGAVRFTYGSMTQPFEIPGVGLPLVSGQLVTYQVAVPAVSAIGGANPVTICSIQGWLYPRKKA